VCSGCDLRARDCRAALARWHTLSAPHARIAHCIEVRGALEVAEALDLSRDRLERALTDHLVPSILDAEPWRLDVVCERAGPLGRRALRLLGRGPVARCVGRVLLPLELRGLVVMGLRTPLRPRSVAELLGIVAARVGADCMADALWALRRAGHRQAAVALGAARAGAARPGRGPLGAREGGHALGPSPKKLGRAGPVGRRAPTSFELSPNIPNRGKLAADGQECGSEPRKIASENCPDGRKIR